MGALLPIGIYRLLAMGLNIVVGYAGLLDLGYAAFFAIGAYTVGFLTSPGSVFVQRAGSPHSSSSSGRRWWSAFIVAAIFGVLLGAPTLRLRGDYLAIVTLGFGEIVPNFFLNAVPLTGGTRGINPIAKPPPHRAAQLRPDRSAQLVLADSGGRAASRSSSFCACMTPGSAAPGRRSAKTSWPRRAWGST